MDGNKDILLSYIESNRTELTETIKGPFKVQPRDEWGVLTLQKDDGEKFVAVVDDEVIFVIEEEKYINDRLPPLVKSLLLNKINDMEKELTKFTEKTNYETNWLFFVKKPETGRWFVINRYQGKYLTITPREVWENESDED